MQSQDFETLVDSHYQDIYRFALSLARNPDDAADLTQDTFVTLARKGDMIREPSKCRSWLFTTLYRSFLKQKRRSQRLTPMDQDGLEMLSPPQDPESPRNIAQHEILEALLMLEEDHRAILSLFYLDDCSYKEIAARLDMPIGTVMSRLSRAKEALRLRLTDKSAQGIKPGP